MAHATDANGDLILGGRMLIVGSYDVNNNQIAGYSNKAGTVCATWDFNANVLMPQKQVTSTFLLLVVE